MVLCVTTGLMTGDWVLAAEMGATTVGNTAVEVVTTGRDCGGNQKSNKEKLNTNTARTPY